MEKLELSVQKEWRFINDRDMDTAVECLKWGGDRVNPSNRAFRVFYRSGGGRDIVTRDREFTNLFRPRVSAIERP